LRLRHLVFGLKLHSGFEAGRRQHSLGQFERREAGRERFARQPFFFCRSPGRTRYEALMENMASTSTTTITTICWSCGKPAANGHFCAECGKIQPLSRDMDYFAFFGLPQKLALDPAELEKRFHTLSWKLHPDNFVRASESERELSLDRSSQLNDAYRTLLDPISRVEYLLAREGMRREGQQKQQAPPELLEEVFELNESLDELRMARVAGGDAEERARLSKTLSAAAQKFQESLARVDAELKQLFAAWDKAVDANADAAARHALMERMNAALNRRSYIRNLVAGVHKELTEEC
jgi:molecular chaperone HscB